MKLSDPSLYANRELSWLSFNDRVLEEAEDLDTPLLERLKFLAISASNLDEFFMVRVSHVLGQVAAQVEAPDHSGLTPKAQLGHIFTHTHQFAQRQTTLLLQNILPALEKEGLSFYTEETLPETYTPFVKAYFDSTVYPIITPMAIDQSHPFPLLNNKSLNFIVELHGKKGKKANHLFAVVQVPTVVPRLLELPKEEDGSQGFIYLESVIRAYLPTLFTGYKVVSASLFRLTRDSDFEVDEEDVGDLLLEIEAYVKRRKWGQPVRIEIEKSMEESCRQFLINAFTLDEARIFETTGPMDLTMWMAIASMQGYDHLRFAPLPPLPSVDFLNKGVFEAIKARDILVSHPFESFDCVVNFVKAAATDPDVLAIKQTLYRVSGHSPIIQALIQAAEKGKQVTVLVELKARFDEENNIIWAKTLEKAGCHVVYGVAGLKTHCKLCLVVRREPDGIRRYVHMGTGNYNDTTAKIYTDLGLFTCKEAYGQDVSALFNVITGYSAMNDWQRLHVAPMSLREAIIGYIDQETAHAQAGKPAHIMAKINALVDTDVIKALYRASMAGVKIQLMVRGICCLRAQVEGVSHNITVASVVDRFLEHSRIFYFANNGSPKVLLSSADWMPRNLDRRIEVAFPIESGRLQQQLIEMLSIMFADTQKLRLQQPDGIYQKPHTKEKERVSSQLALYALTAQKLEAYHTGKKEKALQMKR